MWTWLKAAVTPPRPPLPPSVKPVIMAELPAGPKTTAAAPTGSAAVVAKKGYLGKSAVAALAISFIGGAEGLRQNAYPDPATRGNPWTICYGHTGHVTPGEKASLAECKTLLLADLGTEDRQVESCVHVPMTDARFVAVLSLAHNIGGAGVCKSSIVRDLNAGNIPAACNAFLLYNRAAGVVMPGLTSRRQKERALCLE
jgi:lysozyme